MKRKRLIKSWVGIGGAITIVLLSILSSSYSPGLAQTNSSANVYQTAQATPSTRPSVRPPAGSSPAPSNRSTPAPNAIGSLDREFMLMAAHSDQFEIRSSQLALQKGTSPQVKQYAQMMIEEHTASTQRLTQLATERGITLPTAPNPFQQAVIDQLTPLSGTQFDQAYLAAQTNSHMMAVAVFQTEADQGKDQGVKSFASQLLPTIAQHYQTANEQSGQRNVLNSLRSPSSPRSSNSFSSPAQQVTPSMHNR
jgi:putative membrane protein